MASIDLKLGTAPLFGGFPTSRLVSPDSLLSTNLRAVTLFLVEKVMHVGQVTVVPGLSCDLVLWSRSPYRSDACRINLHQSNILIVQSNPQAQLSINLVRISLKAMNTSTMESVPAATPECDKKLSKILVHV